ncbi:MAG: phosphoenolpyruvate carboxylase [Rickettsiales bacterium]
MTSNTYQQFNSTEQLTLAKELSDAFIEVLEQKGDPEQIGKRLRMLRDVAWQTDEAKAWPPKLRSKWSSERHRVFRAVLKGEDESHAKLAKEEGLAPLSAEGRVKLLTAYAKLGHLYEIAGQAARNNYFNELRARKEPIPGGAREFINKQPDADTALDLLRQPTFEITMTMHPTNTSSRTMMQAHRKLALALEPDSGVPINTDEVMSALQAFSDAHLLPQKDGKDTNFTVRDETDIVLNYLDNLYEDLPRVYRQYARPLNEKYGGTYDPLDLQLNINLGSWGSAGDKDGNQNVTSETTLEAIAMHTQAIVHRYIRSIQDINNEGSLAGSALNDWKSELEEADAQLKQIKKDAHSLSKKSAPSYQGDDKFTPQRAAELFDSISARLAKVRNGLSRTTRGDKPVLEFEQDLVDFYRNNATKDQKQEVLEMIRRVRTFGFNFAKIEYREKASEYGRVIDTVFPELKGLSPEARAKQLTELLKQDDATIKQAVDAKREDIISQGASRPYSDDDAMPIAYHSLRRMELARDFPDMIRDNVLAECGQLDGEGNKPSTIAAQATSNMLEALLMQRMATAKDGKKPQMGVVPLFEEPSTMSNIDKIMRSVYENPVYAKHLETLSDRHEGKKTQQVQIAHSDNARRSGLAAARALIHEAHDKIRSLNKEMGIQTQFFEGGSVSDAYRNGVRAISASVNDFKLHDFAKFTFQGGDLMNYFNSPSSSMRLFTRNIINAAEKYEQRDGKYVLPEAKPKSVFDRVAINAMKRTLQDYQDTDFTQDTMGVLLAVLDYEGEVAAGKKTSRAGKRSGGVGFKQGSEVKNGSILPVNIHNVRTIGFSEAWQQHGIVPSWIGTQNLERYLVEEIANEVASMRKSPIAEGQEGYNEQQQFLDMFGDVDGASPKLDARQAHLLYRKSRVFKDDQDRSAHALAMTDPEMLKLLGKRIDQALRDEPNNAQLQSGKKYLDEIINKKTYPSAIRLAHKAHTEASLPDGDGDRRTSMVQALPRISDQIRIKSQYRDFLAYTRMIYPNRTSLTPHERSLLHNGGDTMMHSRFLAADDPKYGKHVLDNSKQLSVVAGV